jgi:hypothetical protein
VLPDGTVKKATFAGLLEPLHVPSASARIATPALKTEPSEPQKIIFPKLSLATDAV